MPRSDTLLVLDLDETLIHSTRTPLDRRPDFWWAGYAVYERPGVRRFLERCLDRFEVAVWTASDRGYALPVIERLVALDRLSFVLTGERCVVKLDPATGQQVVVKNLAVVQRRGWALSRVLAVDNHPTTWLLNPDNGLRIPDYRGEPEDDVLEALGGYLEACVAHAPDVRQVDRTPWHAVTAARRSSAGSRS